MLVPIDRHKNRSVLNVRLTAEQAQTILQSLPQYAGMTAKICHILRQAKAIAQSQTGQRIEPKNPPSGEQTRYFTVRVSQELHDFVLSYGLQAGLDASKQSTQIVLAWLEQQAQPVVKSVQPAIKEEKRQVKKRQVHKATRSEDLRKGFSLIWRALTKRYN